jgi:hypothetical protein
MALPDRGESLNFRQFFGAFGQLQSLHAHTDRTGGNQKHPAAVGTESGKSFDQFCDGFPGSQEAGSRFYDDLTTFT